MKSTNGCLLSKDMSLGLKGYMAILVFVHHLYQCTGFFVGTYVEYIFYILGRWATVVFVYLSGYGLYSSFKAKGAEYIQTFPKKRLLPYYISCLFFVVTYIIYYIIQGAAVSPHEIFRSLTFGGTIIIYGWYLQMALAFYVIFWIAFRFTKNKHSRSLIILTLIIVYVTFTFSNGLIYYIPALSLMFILGIMSSVHEKKLCTFISKHTATIFIISFMLFVLFSIVYMSYDFLGYVLPSWALEYIIAIFAEIFEITFIVSFIQLVSNKAERIVSNGICNYVGRHSLEIYACQGIFLDTILRLPGNIYLLILTTIIITLLGATLMRYIISQFVGFISKTNSKDI